MYSLLRSTCSVMFTFCELMDYSLLCSSFHPWGLTKQEYWSGVLFPSPKKLSEGFLHCRNTESPGKPHTTLEDSSIIETIVARGKRTRSPPLPQIMQSSFPHLRKSQRSTHSQCNGQALLWENHIRDHSTSPCQVSIDTAVFKILTLHLKRGAMKCWHIQFPPIIK